MFNHLKFLSHGETKQEFTNVFTIEDENAIEVDTRPPIQKHADVVDYLQKMSRDVKVYSKNF
jgi:hypothetical protein